MHRTKQLCLQDNKEKQIGNNPLKNLTTIY